MTIPLSFDYEGIQFEGTLERPTGGGAAWWLYINNFCKGQLVKYDKWYFYSNCNMFEDIAWYFGEVVEKNAL